MSRLWEKGVALDEEVLRFTAGEDHRLDDRLVAFDVHASIAHAEMLGTVGLLRPADVAAISTGLEELAAEHAAGAWRVELADEDCHTALERRLVERIGEAGARVHLGRSRNDQVLAALRLYLLAEVEALAAQVEAVATAFDGIAARQGKLALPGYTHLQPAMPSSVGLWAGGYAAEIRDDAAGLLACRRRLDQNPLGSAAGYGVPLLPVDREETRRRAGFARTQEPVTAVQLSRGKAEAQVLFELTVLMTDLGRAAADLVWFASRELGFVRLPAAMTTGSSIMPQKRNPDVFELIRGRGASALGALVEALAIPAKLPSGYHRDLQGLKAPLFRTLDLVGATLSILERTLPDVEFVPENLTLVPELRATEEAYRLVLEEGVPFREAYRRVGERYNS